MALTIDSHAVLRALADYPEAFPAIQKDLGDLAGKLLIKQIKKTTDAALFAKLYGVTGATTMSTVLDGFAANDLSALVKKIDPHAGPSSDLKAVRSHIADLATGRAQPAAKAEKPAKAPRIPKVAKAAPPKIGGILESKVHSGKKAPAKKKAS